MRIHAAALLALVATSSCVVVVHSYVVGHALPRHPNRCCQQHGAGPRSAGGASFGVPMGRRRTSTPTLSTNTAIAVAMENFSFMKDAWKGHNGNNGKTNRRKASPGDNQNDDDDDDESVNELNEQMDRLRSELLQLRGEITEANQRFSSAAGAEKGTPVEEAAEQSEEDASGGAQGGDQTTTDGGAQEKKAPAGYEAQTAFYAKRSDLEEEVIALRASLDESRRNESRLKQSLADVKRQHALDIEDFQSKLRAASGGKEGSDAELSSLQAALKEAKGKQSDLEQRLLNVQKDHAAEIMELTESMNAERQQWKEKEAQQQKAAAKKADGPVEPEWIDAGEAGELSMLRASLREANQKREELESRLEDAESGHEEEITEVKATIIVSLLQASLNEAKQNQYNLERNLDETKREYSAKVSELNAIINTERNRLDHEVEISNLRESLLNEARQYQAELEETLEKVNRDHAAQMMELRDAFDAERLQWEGEAQLSTYRANLVDETYQNRYELESALQNANRVHAAQMAELEASMEAERAQWRQEAELSSHYAAALEEAQRNQAALERSLEQANRHLTSQRLEPIPFVNSGRNEWQDPSDFSNRGSVRDDPRRDRSMFDGSPNVLKPNPLLDRDANPWEEYSDFSRVQSTFGDDTARRDRRAAMEAELMRLQERSRQMGDRPMPERQMPDEPPINPVDDPLGRFHNSG